MSARRYPNMGTLKKSYPDDPLIRLFSYKTYHQYDKELPKPLQGHGIMDEQFKKEQEAMQKNTLFDCIQHGRILKEMYDEVKKKNRKLLNENKQLKETITKLEEENSSWQKTASHMDTIAREDREFSKRLYKENQQLKEELEEFKEWEKHIRDVKREELDRVFKMSIYEIAEAFEYYKKRIKELEMEVE